MMAAKYMREYFPDIIVFIAEFHNAEARRNLAVSNKSGLPGVFFLHGESHMARKYEYDFKEFEISTEMMVMWSQRELLKINITKLEKAYKSIEVPEQLADL